MKIKQLTHILILWSGIQFKICKRTTPYVRLKTIILYLSVLVYRLFTIAAIRRATKMPPDWHILAVRGMCVLTLRGTVTSYGDIDLCQQWIRQWLVAWWFQSITRTSGDLSSVGFFGAHLRPISQEVIKISILKRGVWKNTPVKLLQDSPVASEIKWNKINYMLL